VPEADPARDTLARLMRLWDWVERTIVGLLGLTALIIAAVQVFGRYIDPESSITWAEEVIVYIVVWAIMIIGSQLVRHDGHVRPDLVLRLLPPHVQRWVEMFNCVVAIVFMGGLLYYGRQVLDTALLLDQVSSSDLQFPMWIYYLSLPVGAGLMAVRYVIRLYRYAFHFDPKTMSVGHNISHEAPAELAMRVVE